MWPGPPEEAAQEVIELRLWVGDYPFLLRPAFEELCQLRLARR